VFVLRKGKGGIKETQEKEEGEKGRALLGLASYPTGSSRTAQILFDLR
jgi:hypothetical protein